MKFKYWIYDCSSDPRIGKAEFVSETMHFVVLKGEVREGRHGATHAPDQRVKKRSGWKNYYDTWEEAHAELTIRAVERVRRATSELERAESHLQCVKDMENDL